MPSTPTIETLPPRVRDAAWRLGARRGRALPPLLWVLLLASIAIPPAARAQSTPDSLAAVAETDSVPWTADTLASGASPETGSMPWNPPPPPSPPPPPPTPPSTLEDPAAWLEYQSRRNALSLPLESRVFYRRALEAHRANDAPEAARLMRAAAQLDPGFLEPRLALIGWSLFRDPAEAVSSAKAVRELLRRDFSAQWTLVANGVLGLFQAWYLALIATALLILMARQAEVRHGIQERLTRWVSVPTATLWSWALFLAPFVTGFGVVLPVLFFLALGWTLLRWRERTLFTLLVVSILAAPWVGLQLTRLATPMQPDASPLSALVALETEGDIPAGRAAFQARAAANPEDPYLAFGRAWLAHQDGDLAGAEAGYRRALASWPNDDRVLNDLGQVLVLQGRYSDAIEVFKSALAVAPNNATVCFNMSQAYTRNYDFQSANAAIARASQIDFDLVSRYKTQAGSGGSLPLVSQWLSSRRMWDGLAHGQVLGVTAWPPAWRGRPETLGFRFAGLALLMVAAGLALGAGMIRGLPLHQCSNCGRVVCRRCSVRRRSESLCRSCSHAVAGAESPEFVRMLLGRQRQRTERLPRLARLLAACLVPGLGLALHHRMFRPLAIALVMSLGVGLLLGPGPYDAHPRITGADSILPPALAGLAIALCYVVSIVGYLAASSRADALAAAAARVSRPTPAPRPRSEDVAPDVEAA